MEYRKNESDGAPQPPHTSGEHSFLRNLLTESFLWDLLQARRARKNRPLELEKLAHWKSSGRPVPPPDLVKRGALLAYGSAFHLKTFIETGTFMGGTVAAMKDHFEKTYSIELSERLAARARRLFRGCKQVEILQGDSAEILPGLLSKISEPCLFWLDGHYSGGVTALAKIETPILQELRTILQHEVKTHVILIDDARLFDGTHDYPTVEEIRALILRERPDFVFSVVNDSIRIHPPGKIETEY